MERQTDHNRPDIRRSGESSPRRFGYALLFTCLVMLSALPFVSTIGQVSNGTWGVSKLRFVAMGTIFCITLALALVAQFALTKPEDEESGALSPVDGTLRVSGNAVIDHATGQAFDPSMQEQVRGD